MLLSVIIPTLNEVDALPAAITSLDELRRNLVCEVIVADGGSTDATLKVARQFADRVLSAPRGRAAQMNAGAAGAHGRFLLFLHADTRLTEEATRGLQDCLEPGPVWGWFDVRLSGAPFALRVIEAAMNWRSRLTSVATGDQAIFVERETFQRLGGFPAIPLMEDIALSKSLRRIAAPSRPRGRVETSSRRWESGGIARTVLLMWRLRLAYVLGADPARLAGLYQHPRARERQ